MITYKLGCAYMHTCIHTCHTPCMRVRRSAITSVASGIRGSCFIVAMSRMNVRIRQQVCMRGMCWYLWLRCALYARVFTCSCRRTYVAAFACASRHGNSVAAYTYRCTRAQAYSAILQQEIGYFDVNKTGDLTSRLSCEARVCHLGCSCACMHV